MSDAYEVFREGQKRLRNGLTAQATVPLERAKRLEPQKASIREALGIAYFRLRRWEEAEREFRTITDELDPTDDYAHYALGRALERQGRNAEANGHYKLASSMKPGSDQYSSRILDLGAGFALGSPGDAGRRRAGLPGTLRARRSDRAGPLHPAWCRGGRLGGR